MATGTSPRRLFTLTGIGLAGLLAGSLVWAQSLPPLSSQWTPGASAGGAGIRVSAFPIVTSEPFTANDNSRWVHTILGQERVDESHGIVARDSEGRVARRNAESPHSQTGGFRPGGGGIVDPVAMVLMNWSEGMPVPGLDEGVMMFHIKPNTQNSRPQPLDPCEGDHSHPRDYPHGETQRIEEIGERTMQGILTRGCRVTTLVPAGARHNDQPLTITDESWSSLEYRITLLHVHHDPSGDERIEQLDNIVRGEPDALLFQPPPGYKIRDMDAEMEAARKEQEQTEVMLPPGGPDAEMLAGPWETGDPIADTPAQMGILINVSAYRRVGINQDKLLEHAPQKVSRLNIRVYQRTAGEDKADWFHTNDRMPYQSETTWDGHQLQIKSNRNQAWNTLPGPWGLDLSFNEKIPAWTGSYTRNGATKAVILERPGASRSAAYNPLLGGWFEEGSKVAMFDARCIYIAQGSDGALVSWRNARRGPSIDMDWTTETLDDDSGDGVGVQFDGDTVTFQEGIYWEEMGMMSGQGPAKFTGKLSPDGSQIIGTWGYKAATFTRLSGQSRQPPGSN